MFVTAWRLKLKRKKQTIRKKLLQFSYFFVYFWWCTSLQCFFFSCYVMMQKMLHEKNCDFDAVCCWSENVKWIFYKSLFFKDLMKICDDIFFTRYRLDVWRSFIRNSRGFFEIQELRFRNSKDFFFEIQKLLLCNLRDFVRNSRDFSKIKNFLFKSFVSKFKRFCSKF